MKIQKSVLVSLMLLTSVTSQAAGDLQKGVLIVPNNGNVGAVLQSLEDNGFEFSGNIQCAQSAKFVRIKAVSETSKTLKISCISNFDKKTIAVPIRTGSAAGDPSEFEGTATGDPSEFEGNATGDPNEFEGNATGDPNEFEGNATGDPNEFEGTATGDPNEFEGNATGSADSGKSPVIKILGKIESAARAVHAKIYQLLTE